MRVVEAGNSDQLWPTKGTFPQDSEPRVLEQADLCLRLDPTFSALAFLQHGSR